jgi:hypothetical protein
MKLVRQISITSFAIIVWLALFTSSTWAAGVVGTGTAGSCDNNDLANALMGGGLVTFNCGDAPHTILSTTYVIAEDTTIRGKNLIILDGENLRQHFIVNDGASLTLDGMKLQNGESAQGGCIAVAISGALTTIDVTFSGCHDVSMTIGGGAVYNLGTFNAFRTTFVSNRAEEEGGALFNRGIFNGNFVIFEANTAGDDSGAIENDTHGQVVLQDAAFIGNSAAGAGGAIGNTLAFPTSDGSFAISRALFLENSSTTFGGAINNVTGRMTIVNSTFFGNSSAQGGAFFSSGNTNTTIIYSTFTNNRADIGGAIYRPLTGFVELGYSILSESRNVADTADQLECDGPALDSLSHNLIDDNSCVDGSNANDIRNTDPQLGPLQFNGGFTFSRMPSSGSPALKQASSGQCIERDQRFAQRFAPCDIGAIQRGGLFESAYMPSIERQ